MITNSKIIAANVVDLDINMHGLLCNIYGKTGMLLVGPKWSDFVFGNILIIAYASGRNEWAKLRKGNFYR